MKIMPTLAFAMLGLTATPGAMQTATVQTGPVQTAYEASAPVTKADVPAPQGVVVADRSNGIAAPAPAASQI